MKHIVRNSLVAFALLVGVPAFADGPLFESEMVAQQHCPKDRVVWVNTKSGVYHFKGQTWYAHTKQGAYVCEREGREVGYRATRNGQ